MNGAADADERLATTRTVVVVVVMGEKNDQGHLEKNDSDQSMNEHKSFCMSIGKMFRWRQEKLDVSMCTLNGIGTTAAALTGSACQTLEAVVHC